MGTKHKNWIFIFASIFPQFSLYAQTASQFIKETISDIKEAIVNTPEKVPSGPNVTTRAGQQLTSGATPKDFAKNQEIYNDISTIQTTMNELMQLVLNVGIDPKALEQVHSQMAKVVELVSKLAIRYELRSDFEISIKQLQGIAVEITNAPKSADFMLFKTRLETILAEIQNKLYTKLES